MNLEKILVGVVDVCKEVGYFIRKEGQSFDLAHIEQKGSFNNLVSYVDKEAEKKLVKQLHTLLPEAGFITEEGTASTSKHHEFNWIIDPLDGTTNFMHSFPIFSISVGLARNEDVILGVVYEINHDECFYTVQGGPAYCNDKIIKVSPVSTLSESLMATGFPYYQSDKKDVYLEIIKSFLDKTHGIRRLGSAAIDLAYVACGRLEGYFEYNLNPWDVAAGTFLVKQAGGKVSDFQGGNNFLHGRELCASCAAIHTEMVSLIRNYWYPSN